MALISCSECGHKVSDQASACPSCGNPLSSAPAARYPAARASGTTQTATEEKVQTIQQTGKRYKGAMLLGAIGMIIGIVMAMGEEPVVGAVLLAGGLATYVYGRFAAWWHHA